MTLCRKNKKWKAIYLTVLIDELDNLGELVKVAVHKNLSKQQLKKEWLVIDMVDTMTLSTNFNPHTGKTAIDLLIYVADVSLNTEKK